jgi:hypothetical protein
MDWSDFRSSSSSRDNPLGSFMSMQKSKNNELSKLAALQTHSHWPNGELHRQDLLAEKEEVEVGATAGG